MKLLRKRRKPPAPRSPFAAAVVDGQVLGPEEYLNALVDVAREAKYAVLQATPRTKKGRWEFRPGIDGHKAFATLEEAVARLDVVYGEMATMPPVKMRPPPR